MIEHWCGGMNGVLIPWREVMVLQRRIKFNQSKKKTALKENFLWIKFPSLNNLSNINSYHHSPTVRGGWNQVPCTWVVSLARSSHLERMSEIQSSTLTTVSQVGCRRLCFRVLPADFRVFVVTNWTEIWCCQSGSYIVKLTILNNHLWNVSSSH